MPSRVETFQAVSESEAWVDVARIARRLPEGSARRDLILLARQMQEQLERGVHANPATATAVTSREEALQAARRTFAETPKEGHDQFPFRAYQRAVATYARLRPDDDFEGTTTFLQRLGYTENPGSLEGRRRALVRSEALRRIADEVSAIFASQGWREALRMSDNDPENCTVWIGPRLHRIDDIARGALGLAARQASPVHANPSSLVTYLAGNPRQIIGDVLWIIYRHREDKSYRGHAFNAEAFDIRGPTPKGEIVLTGTAERSRVEMEALPDGRVVVSHRDGLNVWEDL